MSIIKLKSICNIPSIHNMSIIEKNNLWYTHDNICSFEGKNKCTKKAKYKIGDLYFCNTHAKGHYKKMESSFQLKKYNRINDLGSSKKICFLRIGRIKQIPTTIIFTCRFTIWYPLNSTNTNYFF